MAEKLKNYEWPARRGRAPVYDWDVLLDGSEWRLKSPDDFTSKVDSFVNNAKTQAKNRGKRLRSNKEDDTTVVIQALPADQ